MTTVAAVVLDLETTGLDHEEEHILEIGMVAIDSGWNVVSTFESYVFDHETEARLDVLEFMRRQYFEYPIDKRSDAPEALINAAWVIDQHQKSGLLDALSAGHGADSMTVARRAIDWLVSLDVEPGQMEVTGSNVANFDRRFLHTFMPDLDAYFHYRNGDISSMKTLLRRWAPEVFEMASKQRPEQRGLHRCVADCLDSIAELRSYIDVIA